MKTAFLLATLLATTTGAFEDLPLVCISSPPIQLVAGTSNISAIHDYPFGGRCRALLRFEDPDFVPITYAFNPAFPCSGPQVTSFLVPPGAPNGSARVIWQCAESSTCSFAIVSNGTGDLSLAPEQNGTVGCLPMSLPTNISTASMEQPQSLSTTSSILSNSNNGSNFTATNQPPQITTTAITEVNSATRPSGPSTMSWTILTITQTVTSLLTLTTTSFTTTN